LLFDPNSKCLHYFWVSLYFFLCLSIQLYFKWKLKIISQYQYSAEKIFLGKSFHQIKFFPKTCWNYIHFYRLDKDLVLEESHSEHGSFYASPVTIPAGQYDSFLHTKTAWAALGSKGYVRYSYVASTYFEGSGPIQENKKNIYFGWDTPWSGTNKFGVRVSDSELPKSQKETMMRDLNKNYQHHVVHYEYKTRDYKLTPIVEIHRDESSPLLYYSITRTNGNFSGKWFNENKVINLLKT